MILFRATLLFFATAVAEIMGCYLPYLWLRRGKSPILLLPAALSFAVFAWLLTLHPTGAARTYAAYGGVYVAVALAWLWVVEGQRPSTWDLVGASVAVASATVVARASRAFFMVRLLCPAGRVPIAVFEILSKILPPHESLANRS